MKHVTYTLKLTLQAPVLTHTSGSIGFGLDAAMLRNKDNKPVFTGSLIRGNLRHSLKDFNELTTKPSMDTINKWFGEEATLNLDPNTALLEFSEYWVDEEWKDKVSKKRYRIAIDEKTGAVKIGALQVIESPYEVGEEVTFVGTIDATFTDDTKINSDADDLQQWLKRAFTLIPAIGALKTNGFGKVMKVSITHEHASSTRNTSPLAESILSNEQLGLRIKPQSPFCFAKPAIGENNHFEAEHHIPAAGIVAAVAKGILADSKKYDKLTPEVLSKIHFTHARPVPEGGKLRPVSLPLSVVKADKFHNIAATKDVQLIDNRAPAFLIDWKPPVFSEAHKKLNSNAHITPRTELKIRTAIQRKTGTAKESQLYSMETVQPDGCDWLANISLSKIQRSERADIIKQLHELLKTPLHPLGKTKASAQVSLETPYPYDTGEKSSETKNQENIVIYIQSTTRLLDTGFRTNGTNQQQPLLEAYQKAWSELSNDSLKLSHFFAQQKLEGGIHWWKRFRERDSDKCYHPELFTCEGSVFVFTLQKGKEQEAKELLLIWQKLGLPQLSSAPGGEDWKKNPWIAANGYGEIAVNLKIDEALNDQV